MSARLAAKRDIETIVSTLVAGFQDDPVFSWMYPDTGERPGMLAGWFGTIVPFAFNHGHCYLLPEGEAVAVWVPPDLELISDSERGNVVELLAGQVGMERAMTVAQGFAAAGAHHREDPPSFQLAYVAVLPAARSRGLGVEVLAPVIDRLDSDGFHGYLHSTNGRNLPFYCRLGFKVLAEVSMPGDGPVIRPMWREPQPETPVS